jgi:hypothetical protein
MKLNQKNEKEWFENFLYFLNADIKSLSETKFHELLLKYTRFLCHRESIYDFLNFRKKFDGYTEGLLERSDEDILSDRKEFFSNLQLHLRDKIDKIIALKNSKNQIVMEILSEMKGTRKLVMASNEDNLIEGFWPDDLADSDMLDLNNEKKIADLALFDLTQQFRLNPENFGLCKREKCKKLFYQFTDKKRIYCSNKCGTAARQEKFQAGKKKDTNKKPKKSRKT